jgi:hypothetical protein
MDHSVLDRPAELTAAPPTTRRRRGGPAPRPVWGCENCATPNAGRRKRCVECGTTRD